MPNFTSQRAVIGEANFGEWPHVCAIIKEVTIAPDDTLGDISGDVNVYLCGASLIAPQVSNFLISAGSEPVCPRSY